MAGEFLVPVLIWLAIIKVLQLSIWPALDRTLGRLAPAAAYPASVLLFTLVSGIALRYPGPCPNLAKHDYASGVLHKGTIVFVVQMGCLPDPFLFMLEVR